MEKSKDNENDLSKPYEGFDEILFNQTSAATKIQIPMTWHTIFL